MKKRLFGEFVNKKKRESVRQLGLVRKLLEQTGMKVDNFLEDNNDDDPYIYCHNPSRNGSFDGIRIYKIGEGLAFRIQKENKTHPYGSAYPLPIEEMFHDFLSDEKVDEKKAGQKIIEAVSKEIKRFFEKTIEAEKFGREQEIDKNGGDVAMRNSPRDYSSMIYNKS